MRFASGFAVCQGKAFRSCHQSDKRSFLQSTTLILISARGNRTGTEIGKQHAEISMRFLTERRIKTVANFVHIAAKGWHKRKGKMMSKANRMNEL
jgi:hypothetical protein